MISSFRFQYQNKNLAKYQLASNDMRWAEAVKIGTLYLVYTISLGFSRPRKYHFGRVNQLRSRGILANVAHSPSSLLNTLHPCAGCYLAQYHDLFHLKQMI